MTDKLHKLKYVFFAFLAAVFYALNMPFSKRLLGEVPPTLLAAFLYLGAGIGVGGIYLASGPEGRKNGLKRSDLPYTLAMIALDIAAPILLMLGLSTASASGASHSPRMVSRA